MLGQGAARGPGGGGGLRAGPRAPEVDAARARARLPHLCAARRRPEGGARRLRDRAAAAWRRRGGQAADGEADAGAKRDAADQDQELRQRLQEPSRRLRRQAGSGRRAEGRPRGRGRRLHPARQLHRQRGRRDGRRREPAHRAGDGRGEAPVWDPARAGGRDGGPLELRLAVLRGGKSAEREVSMRSGEQVAKALRARGHHITLVDLDGNTWDVLRDGGFECVFNALHGRLGEDGTVQGMLELLGLPYTGSGVLASALCMDKARAGKVMAGAGLHVPEFEEMEIKEGVAAELVEGLVARFGLPLVIKPVREGSTIGLTIARDEDAVASGLVLAARYDRRVLVQRFAAGTEITVGVLATPELQVLPTLEIVSENPVYDYDAKYTAGRSHHIIPARIPEAAREGASAAAARAFTELGCSGMARVDIIVDAAGTPWLLEVNTVPGLTELSLLPDAARAAGVAFDELCMRLVEHAVGRHQHHAGRTAT